MKKIFVLLYSVLAFGWGIPIIAENIKDGTNAGKNITTGDANIFIGEMAGLQTTAGIGNIFIGYSAGNRNTTGNNNIYMGYLAGTNLTGSNKYVLRNYPYATTIFAHLDSQKVAINATNALGYNLYVSGTAKITGATTFSTSTFDSVTSGRFLSSLTGAANNAAISPSNDKNTGLYWLTATGNRMGITAAGTQVGLWDSVGTGVITGTAAAPSLHNLNDRDTGLYWLTATGNRLGLTTGGTSHVIVDSTGVAVRGKIEARGNVIPLTDSLQTWRSSNGNTVASVDSTGNLTTTGTIKGETVRVSTNAQSMLANKYEAISPTVDMLLFNTQSSGNVLVGGTAVTVAGQVGIGEGTPTAAVSIKGKKGATNADSLLVIKSSGGTTRASIDSLGNANFAGSITGLQNVVVSDAAIAPTARQSGTMWVCRPLTAKRTATLPDAAAGLNYTFFVDDADSLLITTASGDSLITSAGAAWKTTSSVAGTAKVVAYDTTRWLLVTTLGTWTSY